MGDDGLSGAQFRLLLLGAVGIGALLLIAIIGVTAASFVWGGGDAGGPPEAGFTVETVDRSDGVAANVTHAGGEAATPGSIVIEVNGEDRGTWEELGGEGPDIVGPGHGLRYANVTAGDTVKVVWTDGEERTVLGEGTMGQGTSE